MYAVMRQYSGVRALIEVLEQKQDEVTRVMQAIPGFVAYYAVRDGEALATITISQTREGAEESTRQAAQWLRDNVSAQRVRPPAVVGGEVFIHAG